MKKLHNNQLPKLEEAIKQVQGNPHIGELKSGDLANVRVYKFSIFNQLTLLAYLYNEQNNELTLLALAPHENFYRDLKKRIWTRFISDYCSYYLSFSIIIYRRPLCKPH